MVPACGIAEWAHGSLRDFRFELSNVAISRPTTRPSVCPAVRTIRSLSLF